MKTISVIKKEVMKFDIQMYAIWIVCLVSGCMAYLNAPDFILQMGDVFSFLRKTGELVWGLLAAFLMGVVAIIATKVGTRLWEDKVKPFYERVFNKKKNKKNSGK